MKDYLVQLVRASASPLQARNVAREYLQARVLEGLQRAGAMVSLAFHGGTALRFLFALPRYSEDLGFALEREPERYDLRTYLRQVQSDLTREGYAAEVKLNDTRTVQNAFVRFAGLPHELGLSPHRTEVLAVKVEVDTRPPAGAGLAITLVRRHVTLRLQHHDRASLLAGKLHAVIQRPFAKGRDLYDLLWYLSDPAWPEPNLVLLTNALQQSGWTEALPGEATWRSVVAERVQALEWATITRDVEPFLASEHELRLLTRENVLQALNQPRPSR